MGVERAASEAPRKQRQRTEPGLTPSLGVGWTKPERYLPQTVFIRTSCNSYLHSPTTLTIIPLCQHLIFIMFTFCGMLLRTPTSMLAIPLTLQHGSKRITPGMFRIHLKYAPWEIHSAIAVQTEEQATELEKYFKSHSGREWVIKHLGLPIGMKSLS